MAIIFVSKASELNPVANRLKDELEVRGHDVRFDSNLLAGGDDWRMELASALRSSDAVVALLAERNSEFVWAEIGAARTYALSKGTLVLPVIIGSMGIPRAIADLNVLRVPDRDDESHVCDAAARINEAIDKHMSRLRGKYPPVFISHRHKDRELVTALVTTLQAAFDLTESDVRCTSVPPYKLKAGARTPDRLKSEIARARAVLGVVTPDTSESSYVLFELGAAWGQDVMTFPLLAKGATMENIPSPISDRHPLKLTDRDDCEQLVDDLADVTGWARKPEADLSGLITALTNAAAAAPAESPDSPTPERAGTPRRMTPVPPAAPQA
jgi:hypothetical protein